MEADPLATLLAEVRDAVQAGDLARLALMPDRIEAALSRPLQDRTVAQDVRARAESTALLLAAALRGVRAARRRAAEVQAHDRLTTYDAAGHRGEVTAEPAPARRL